MSCCGQNKIVTNSNPIPAVKEDCCGKQTTQFTKYSLLNAGKSVIKHFVDPTYNAFSSDEVKKNRLETCMKCDMIGEFFGKSQCKVCKCFVEPKSSLIDQKCPHPQGSKW